MLLDLFFNEKQKRVKQGPFMELKDINHFQNQKTSSEILEYLGKLNVNMKISNKQKILIGNKQYGKGESIYQFEKGKQTNKQINKMRRKNERRSLLIILKDVCLFIYLLIYLIFLANYHGK
ncbi:transmembrane protein, putative (macronuclear) [Tetrahymena thermophila SB210]|uniref:Transmembrane protein, putative n=1 Tax=Tetrahymena thermophila (strain SB210) TaxID=312017 RepID=W7XFV9_TETTS|nr:transmembrane protein, putative [Tetrahymena thermophila SB210]EWS72916.1 transmembrane protein, putative [Tetrahymena thermophila SB210]|eukprot:XP_012654556.1 transmembrane protein, putative [Tetrahymena thermophila SB210]